MCGMFSTLRLWILVFAPLYAFSQPNIAFEIQTLSGEPLSQPVDIASARDGSDRLFIVEKRGTIKIIENGTILSPYFLDIQGPVLDGGERGLLGIAFHPNYPDSSYFYVNYVGSGNVTHIARYTVNPLNTNDALENSEKTILTVNQPYNNHNAGDLAFGKDGYLYFGLGDGGDGGDPQNRSQNGQTLLGKMIRIDINTSQPYLIPDDNPFIANAAVRNEIWAIGLRNPWRFSFDAQTGDMWIADVGQNIWEEIHIQPALSPGGENYGWDCYEASADFEVSNCDDAQGTLMFPSFEYPHSGEVPDGWTMGYGNSITGGFVYRGNQYPALKGYYICADFSSNYVWLLNLSNSLLALEVFPFDMSAQITSISSFGESDSGEIYATSLDGFLYQVKVDEPLAIGGLTFQAKHIGKSVQLEWKVAENTAHQAYVIERSGDGVQFDAIGKLDAGRSIYRFQDTGPLIGMNYYRISVEQEQGIRDFSNIESVYFHSGQLFELGTNQRSGDILINMHAHSSSVQIQVYNIEGRLLWAGAADAPKTNEILNIGNQFFIPGLYIIKASDGVQVQTERVMIR
jgi:glucose/arabinose dehydrogenase